MSSSPIQSVRPMLGRDRAAQWERLYREHAASLYGFAFRLCGDPHDAADLVQQALVDRVLPRVDELDVKSDLGPYLRRTLRHLYLDELRRGVRVQVVAEVPEPELPPPLGDDPERAVLVAEQRRTLNAALEGLTPAQRRVLALRELDPLSYRAIAEVVGVPESTVTKRLYDARMSLRRRFRIRHLDLDAIPEACRERLPQLSRHIDGEERDVAELERHLASCGVCQAARAEMADANRRYRAIVPPIIAVPELLDRLEGASVTPASAGMRRGIAGIGGLPAIVAVIVVGVVAVAVVVLTGGGRSGWEPVATDFSDGSAGWTISADAFERTPIYSPTGGNPGGHVLARNQVTGSTWFWRAPARYHGDVSPAYGRNLTFDLRQSPQGRGYEGSDVNLLGAGLVLTFNAKIDPGPRWTTFRIPLSATSGWQNAVAGAPATEQELRAALADVTELFLRGEYVNNADVIALDNVVLGAS